MENDGALLMNRNCNLAWQHWGFTSNYTGRHFLKMLRRRSNSTLPIQKRAPRLTSICTVAFVRKHIFYD